MDRPALAASRERGQRRSRAVDRPRLHPPARQHLLEDAPIGRVVVDDQHRRSSQVGGLPATGCAPVPRCHAEVRDEVEPAPSPTSLSIQIRPPISSTSCEEIARPRPVPP